MDKSKENWVYVHLASGVRLYGRTLLPFRGVIEAMQLTENKFLGVYEPIMITKQAMTPNGLEVMTHPIAHFNNTEGEYYLHKDSIVTIAAANVNKDLEAIIDGARNLMERVKTDLILPPTGVIQGDFKKNG